MQEIDFVLYNSHAKRKDILCARPHPSHSSHPSGDFDISLYLCGPTVYNDAHIGNARPAIIFDVLRRLLSTRWTVKFVSNITDIDDKIMARAEKDGRSIEDISAYYSRSYKQDMKALGVLPPDIQPKATEHIAHMIELITLLLKKNHAYIERDHVLFSVPSCPSYGDLSHRSLDDMIAGARVEVAPYKRHPSDFILWKPSQSLQAGWDSPWGRGRPGWHIECSAMIKAHLGDEIDIHAGGCDLIFPHHENERAQTACAWGGQLARFWLHNELVIMDKDKMSKSSGNVATIKDLRKTWDGEILRLALLMTHYRKQLYWTHQTPHRAKDYLDRIYRALLLVEDIEPIFPKTLADNDIYRALLDDLNLPKALALLADYGRQVNHNPSQEEKARLKGIIMQSAGWLGLLRHSPSDWFHQTHQFEKKGEGEGVEPKQIELLIGERQTARLNKDFKRADEIRHWLSDRDIILEDSASATTWHYKKAEEGEH